MVWKVGGGGGGGVCVCGGRGGGGRRREGDDGSDGGGVGKKRKRIRGGRGSMVLCEEDSRMRITSLSECHMGAIHAHSSIPTTYRIPNST